MFRVSISQKLQLFNKATLLNQARNVANSNTQTTLSKNPLQFHAFAELICRNSDDPHEYFSRFSAPRVYQRRRFQTFIPLAINFHGFIDWNFWFGREQPSVFLRVVINFSRDTTLRLLSSTCPRGQCFVTKLFSSTDLYPPL